MNLNLSFTDLIKQYIIDNNLFFKRSKSKYNLDDILSVIEYVLITGASWRSLKLPIFKNKFKWESYYYHFNRWSKLNVFKNVYLQLLNKYIQTNKSENSFRETLKEFKSFTIQKR